MKRIALIGECMIELNGAPFGAMHQTFGGDSLNSAVYLARAAGGQVEVNYVTAMGTDALSQGMIQRWQAESVNTDLVLQNPDKQPGLYLIQLDEHGERTFLYWRNDSAARYLLQHPQFSRVDQALAQMDAAYVSGISLAILPAADREQLLTRLTELRQQGVEIVFDSNYRPALWASAEQARNAYAKILGCTSLALVTDDDEQTLWGDSSPEQTLVRLQQAGVEQAVVKMGSQGCYYQHFATQRKPLLIPTTPVDTVVDTTSAGDSFNAGFLAGYLTGKTPEQSGLQGHALAGVVIQHKGAIISSEFTAPVTGQFNRK